MEFFGYFLLGIVFFAGSHYIGYLSGLKKMQSSSAQLQKEVQASIAYSNEFLAEMRKRSDERSAAILFLVKTNYGENSPQYDKYKEILSKPWRE